MALSLCASKEKSTEWIKFKYPSQTIRTVSSDPVMRSVITSLNRRKIPVFSSYMTSFYVTVYICLYTVKIRVLYTYFTVSYSPYCWVRCYGLYTEPFCSTWVMIGRACMSSLYRYIIFAHIMLMNRKSHHDLNHYHQLPIPAKKKEIVSKRFHETIWKVRLNHSSFCTSSARTCLEK